MSKTPLSKDWTLTLGAGPVPVGIPARVRASVPGCVHSDLLENELIPDPYRDCNEELVQWIGETDVTYSTQFDLVDEGHERIDLVAEGLDTVATLRLNGTEVGRVKNQHRGYRFDVRSLISSENELLVDFDAPLRAARESQQRIGVKPLVGDALPYNSLRKMASNFGWDWGPTLTTAGIWRPIHIHRWSTARLASVVPTVLIDENGGSGRVEVLIDLERTGGDDVTLDVELLAPDGAVIRTSQATTESSVTTSLTVDDPELWWPCGYGEQPLYGLTVTARTGDRALDCWTHDIGFRTVDVRMQPDDYGTCFEFYVNGQFVWIKGANWIPGDCFPGRMTKQGYDDAIQGAADAGFNMVRAWGGGIYETDDFYDACNRRGILVWQDFQFACACYSEDPEMWAEVEAEARENVGRLAPNPALTLWSGGNENVEGYTNWGFKARMAEDEPWGSGYYEDLLPRILAEIDPTRAYIPSSPFTPLGSPGLSKVKVTSSPSAPLGYADPTNVNHGPVHSWKVWFSVDYLQYRNTIPRFVAEFGFQAPANYATLMPAIHDERPAPDSPDMLAHQKAIDGNLKLERGWVGHVREPTSFDDWYFTTQLNQARAIGCAVAHWRSHAPRNAGYIVWQLNDCWPAISWAVVDCDGRRKPLWYALRRLNAPRVLLLQPRENGVALIASNDSAEPWADIVEIGRRHRDGRVLASEKISISVPTRSNVTILLPQGLRTPGDPTQELLVASTSSANSRAWWWFVEDVELDLPEPSLRTEVRPTDRGTDIAVTADALVKDLVINVDRLDPDATVSEQLITLLPGESFTFSVTGRGDLDPEALTSPPVLMSANHLAFPRSGRV